MARDNVPAACREAWAERPPEQPERIADFQAKIVIRHPFRVEEVLTSLDEASTELSNEQLEAIAGGLLQMPFALEDDPLAE